MSNTITRRRALSILGGMGLAAFGLSACSKTSSGGSSSGDGKFKIGVLQLTEHAALDAANKGFVKALDDSGINYTIAVSYTHLTLPTNREV